MKKSKKKKICSKWFKNLRNSICKELEDIEKSDEKFKRKYCQEFKCKKRSWWGRDEYFKRKTFEKAGVNISIVFGNFSDNLKGKFQVLKNHQSFGLWHFSCYSSIFSKIPCTYEYKTYYN